LLPHVFVTATANPAANKTSSIPIPDTIASLRTFLFSFFRNRQNQ
jgi:hypothetical protein